MVVIPRMLWNIYTQVWSCFKENTEQIIAGVTTLKKMKVCLNLQ